MGLIISMIGGGIIGFLCTPLGGWEFFGVWVGIFLMVSGSHLSNS